MMNFNKDLKKALPEAFKRDLERATGRGLMISFMTDLIQTHSTEVIILILSLRTARIIALKI